MNANENKTKKRKQLFKSNWPQGRQRRHRADPELDHSWGTARRDQRGLSAPVWVCSWGLSWGHSRGERRKAEVRQKVRTRVLLSGGIADTPRRRRRRYAAVQPSAPETWGTEADITLVLKKLLYPAVKRDTECQENLQIQVKIRADKCCFQPFIVRIPTLNWLDEVHWDIV